MKNNEDILVSVVVPSYNRANYLENCIKSILKQTYANIEVIIVDDGSTDNTGDIVRSFSDERIKYVKQSNNGACSARNNGIDHAKGNLIAFNDSDDIWKEDKVEKQLDFIMSNNYDMVFCGMTRIQGGVSRYFPPYRDTYVTLDINRELTSNQASTQTIMIKTEVARKVKFDLSFKRLQDWDFTLRVLEEGYSIGFLDEALVVAEVCSDSITNVVKSEKAYLHLIEMHQDEFDSHPAALARVYEVIAYRIRKEERNKADYYLKKSIALKLDLKTIGKLIFNKLGMW